MKIRTRYAPSPTGLPHIGVTRTGIFNYLQAKKHGGDFILRIEDSDKERSTEESKQSIIENLDWLGIKYDELYVQSDFLDDHKKAINTLIADGNAYVSKEESKKEPGKMVEVVRFKNPNKTVTFADQIRGEVTFDTTDLGDFVIARNMDSPLHHLVVVVDDHAMGITHIIRGEDLLSNTPRQILIFEALGYPIPQYAHLPLILGADRSKLSKRHGATSITQYREEGYVPEALINYLVLLGWHPEGDQEIFTLEELVDQFDLDRVQKGGAAFSLEKLDWINKEHLEKLDDAVYTEHLNLEDIKSLPQYSEERFAKVLPLIRERLHKFSDFNTQEFAFFFQAPEYEKENLLFKGKGELEDTKKHLEYVQNTLSELQNEAWSDPEAIKASIWDYASEVGRGDVLWPLRYCLSGLDKSPDPFSLLSILGKEESLERIESAISRI